MPAESAELPSRRLLDRDVSSPAYSKYTATGNGIAEHELRAERRDLVAELVGRPGPKLSLLDGSRNASRRSPNESSRSPPPYCIRRLTPIDQPGERLDGKMQACQPRLAGSRCRPERDVRGLAGLREKRFVAQLGARERRVVRDRHGRQRRGLRAQQHRAVLKRRPATVAIADVDLQVLDPDARDGPRRRRFAVVRKGTARDEKMVAGLPIDGSGGFLIALRAHAVPIRQRRVGAREPAPAVKLA